MGKSVFLSIFMSLLMPLAAAADSYTSLWKQHATAADKDQPKTCLRILGRIADKAGREHAYGHLLKAQLCAVVTEAEMSPDSLRPAVERLQLCERNAEAAGDVVTAAVYQSVLGTLYSDNAYLLDDGEAIGARYFKKSMSHPDALAAAFATGYVPFVIDGVDSKYYYDDMLHIIGMRAGDYRTMHDYYAVHGKREGALLTALELARRSRKAGDAGHVKKSRYIMSLDSLAREYGDLLPCGEVAIERYMYMDNAEDVSAEDKINYINYALMKWGAWPRMNVLRNAQRKLTLPSFHASLGGGLALPGVPRKVRVMALNNIGELRLTAMRLDIDGTTTLNPSVDKDYTILRRHIVAGEQPLTDMRRYIGQPDYKVITDTLEIDGLRPGVYLVEMATDNVSVPVERSLLRVCNIYPVMEALPGNRRRVAVLNATTGEAVPGAKIDILIPAAGNGKAVTRTYTCDSNGEVYIDSLGGRASCSYRVYTDTERAFPFTSVSGNFYYTASKPTVESTAIYTDRRIYRPGQTVHAAAIAYVYNNKVNKGEAKAGRQITMTLRDANRKEVARQTVTTDEYGMASADFVLPQGGLTGLYTLAADYGQGAYASFTVEEYKRPTFRVDIGKADVKYVAGDTVALAGKAETFAGVPVQGARVAVQVVRRPSVFWRGTGSDMRSETVSNDTVMTAADGKFTVRVPITVPDTYDERPRRYYTFDVTADVTDVSGETRHGEASLPFSDHPTILTCDVPEKTLRDSLRTVTFGYCNNAGEPIDGDVTFYIDSKRYTCKANIPAKIDAAALASARHKLVAVCGTDTLRTAFTTFTLLDTKAPETTHDWFYQSATRFKDSVTPVFIQVGSSDSIQHVVYTLVAGDRIVDEGRADLKNELRTRAITYREEWGDGVTLSVAWVKSGHAYTHTARIERPLPDTRLDIKWTTFRDRLTPGQRETWTLNITHPDGTPARAQLMATMYDKSLDEIRRHNMAFALPVYTSLPWIAWSGVHNRDVFAYSEMPMRFLDERALDFSRFTGFDLFIAGGQVLSARPRRYRAYGNVLIKYDDEVLEESTVASAPMMSAKQSAPVLAGRAGDMADGDNSAPNTAGSMDGEKTSDTGVQVRENLNETAFFYPGLVTDDKGNVSLSFTLPESVTTWQMYALAHDRYMNSGTVSATAVAKKTVMVQPNVPRFVRSADRGTLSARISNTSDRQQTGTARLALVNPETGKEVYRTERKFSVKAGETVSADFAFDMAKIKNDGLLICRVTASGRGYSDGEQHYLPVLPDCEMVTNTYAFSQNSPGTVNVDLDRLFGVKDKDNKLTVEYTNSPAWLMIQTLPTLATADGDNAISLASAYYANSIGRHIMRSTPAINQTVQLWKQEQQTDGTSLQSALQRNQELRQTVLAETPWLAAADRETEQKQMLTTYFDESLMDYRLADNMARLQRLQHADGSFAWWKGMDGSPYMTMSVLQTLVRLNRIVGTQKATADMTGAAFAYMDKQMAREVSDMKKVEANSKNKYVRPSELAVQYMYAVSLAGREMKPVARKNYDYLVDRLARQNTAFSIYGKAVSAVILAANNHRKEAADLMESLRQYTVYREETGRYFDTSKALYSWFDYRIPSQVAAIEALKALQPGDTQTIAEMQRWLLQSKRTQAWDTPLNTVNAVYAFLGDGSSVLETQDGQHATLRLNGQKLDMPKCTAGLGYAKTAKTGGNFRQLTVEKTSDGTSWGAVYAQFMQPVADVADAAVGMAVTREVLKNGERMTGNTMRLRVGDRVTVRLTVVADRDYDFVQLADQRAACLEPAQQLSGYGYGYYCQPKDNVTNYFFDRMAKGKHMIETTYYVDRKGRYQTGTCTVQCAYSPEFMARAKAVTIDVE